MAAVVRRTDEEVEQGGDLTEFRQRTRFEHILVEFGVVADRKDHLVQSSQQFDVVWRDVAQLDHSLSVIDCGRGRGRGWISSDHRA